MSAVKEEKLVARSGKLREKRTLSGQPRQRSSSPSNSGGSAKVSPVITRKTDRQAGAREAATGQPRRKVVYKVGADGVETRLPAIPILHFSWQWISGLLAVLLFLFTIILINSKIFRVRSLKVEGLTRYAAEEFQPLIKGRKTSLFLFNTNEVMQSFSLVYPELQDPQISIDMPNQVIISAAERQPIILWQANDGAYWIDAEGVVMAKRGEIDGLLYIESPVAPPLAVTKNKSISAVDYARMVIERKAGYLTSEELVDRIDSEVLQAIIEMSAILPEGASLVFDPIAGMGWRDSGGWEVFFGTDLSNIDLKQIEYQTILAKLDEMGVTPAMISVEHVDSPYFRME